MLQRRGRDAQQSHGLALPVLAPQRARHFVDGAVVVDRLRQRALPRDGAESVVAQLHRKGARAEPIAAQSPRHLIGQPQQRALQELGILTVLGQRHLMPHRLRVHALVIRDHGRLVVAPRGLAQVLAHHAEALLQDGLARVGQRAHGGEPHGLQVLGQLRAHAPQLLHVHGPVHATERGLIQRRDAARLLQAARHLGDEFVRTDAERRTQMMLVVDAVLQVPGHLQRRVHGIAALRQSRQVQKRLVDAERFHVGRDR